MSTPGLRKIHGFCEKAKQMGYEWGWVDTCCVDKESNTELSEAINSMYKWYEDAALCIVYLTDVSSTDTELNAPGSAFRRSRWFTRGWTLQELIAPRSVYFFSSSWTFLSCRSAQAPLIEEICGVPRDLGLGRALVDFTIAQRMSWAASRVTSRREDMAYCLLGLFQITMPLIYGERDQAFQRLQKKIIKKFPSDQPILSWGFDLPDELPLLSSGDPDCMSILARSPSDFRGCGDIVSIESPSRRRSLRWETRQRVRTMEVKGTRIYIEFHALVQFEISSLYSTRLILCLPCRRLSDPKGTKIGIRLHSDIQQWSTMPELVLDLFPYSASKGHLSSSGRLSGCKPVKISGDRQLFTLRTNLNIFEYPRRDILRVEDGSPLTISPSSSVFIVPCVGLTMTPIRQGPGCAIDIRNDYIAVHRRGACPERCNRMLAIFACTLSGKAKVTTTSTSFLLQVKHRWGECKGISWRPEMMFFAKTEEDPAQLTAEELDCLNWYWRDNLNLGGGVTIYMTERLQPRLLHDIRVFYCGRDDSNNDQQLPTSLFSLLDSNPSFGYALRFNVLVSHLNYCSVHRLILFDLLVLPLIADFVISERQFSIVYLIWAVYMTSLVLDPCLALLVSGLLKFEEGSVDRLESE